MKVLHVETGMNLYGGALQVFYLLRGLQGRGIENLLLCPEGSEIGRAAAPFAEVRQLPMRGELDPFFGWRFARLVRDVRPDLLHIHSRRGADLWGAVAARLTGVPALVTRRVDNPEPALFARLKYRQYTQVVAISEGIRSVLLAEGMPPERTRCIHSAVDLRAWQQPCDRTGFRERFGLDAEARTVAVIAQLIPRKGHRFLIEAAPSILAAVPQARFLFFGKGPLRDELESLCQAGGIAEKVVFAGFLDDLQRIMPCLDLVVHPALMEGLGVSLLQAAAAGVPIVASRAGGMPEVVRDGVNGILIEPGDTAAIGRAVVTLLTDRQRREELGAGGKTLVESHFSIERMVEDYLRLYRQMPGCGRTHPS